MKRVRLFLVLCLLFLLAFAADAAAQCPNGSPPPCAEARRLSAQSPRSVAVLYFDNLSPDASNAYLADGLTEEVIVHLGQVQRLEVISRSAVRRFRGRQASPSAVGDTLGAAYIVSGAVRAAGARLRVTVELARTRDGARVWGEVFDRNSTDLFEIQAGIAEAVATAIAGRLLPEERRELKMRPTADPRAYDLFLRGQFFFARFTEDDIRRAIDLYAQALTRDSTFSVAAVASAVAWNHLADDWIAPLAAYPKARIVAERALRFDTTAIALSALFWAVISLDRDVEKAAGLARLALDRDARRPESHQLSFVVASIRGDGAAATAAARKGWEADTLSYQGAFFYSEALGQNREFDELAAFVERARTIMPAREANGWKGLALLGQGACTDAVPLLRAASESHFKMDLGAALVCAGRIDEARAVLDSMITEAGVHYINAYFVAALMAALGNRDGAFTWLDRADREHTTYLAYLPTDFRWDGIRSDARFDALLARLGFGARR